MAIGSGLLAGQFPAKGHLVRGTGGLAGEIIDLRNDMVRVLAPLAAIAVEEFTDPPAADVNAIKTSIASSASAQSYSGTALNGAVGAGVMSPPRNITITTSGHGDIDAVKVLITGKDINGAALTEEITLTNGGGVTNAGVKAFASVTSIAVPAQSGTGGALEFGFGDIIGLAKKLVSRAGAPAIIVEITGNTRLAADGITGTFALPAVGAPNGTYTPFAVPSGTLDYAVYYEYDPSADVI